MNKNLWIIVLVVIVIIGGIVIVSKNSSDTSMMEGNDAMVKDESGTLPKNENEVMGKDDLMMKSGSYETYSPEKLALAEKGDVVLFFRASWCPTCRGLDADIRANIKNIPAGVTILDVDYDNSTLLKQKYGVTYQHTLVQVDKDGSQIAKWMGSPTLASLVTNIK